MYVGDNMPGKTKPPVYAVSSTQSAAKKIRDAGFSHLSSGTVTGIPGVS
jgi:predicted ATP-grasp superfamily ATP-dependent carboligase